MENKFSPYLCCFRKNQLGNGEKLCVIFRIFLKLNHSLLLTKLKANGFSDHVDLTLNRSNNSVFLLPKPIEIGKSLISSAPREFEWNWNASTPGVSLRIIDSMFLLGRREQNVLYFSIFLSFTCLHLVLDLKTEDCYNKDLRSYGSSIAT